MKKARPPSERRAFFLVRGSSSVTRMSFIAHAPLATLLLGSILTLTACSADTTPSDAAIAAEPPAAQETRSPIVLVGQYKAFLYGPDHRDASGAQHAEAWQVLREDRINYHDRNQRQEADQSDPVFSDPASRELMEEVVANGTLTAGAARKIVERDVLVQVNIFERDGKPARLDVTVY